MARSAPAEWREILDSGHMLYNLVHRDLTVRYKRSVLGGIARRTMAPAAAVTAVTDVIREEAEGYVSRPVPSQTISNGCDFDDFAGYQHRGSAKLRLLHAGYFFGVRSPHRSIKVGSRSCTSVSVSMSPGARSLPAGQRMKQAARWPPS